MIHNVQNHCTQNCNQCNQKMFSVNAIAFIFFNPKLGLFTLQSVCCECSDVVLNTRGPDISLYSFLPPCWCLPLLCLPLTCSGFHSSRALGSHRVFLNPLDRMSVCCRFFPSFTWYTNSHLCGVSRKRGECKQSLPGFELTSVQS
jgi:hypothetical protein